MGAHTLKSFFEAGNLKYTLTKISSNCLKMLCLMKYYRTESVHLRHGVVVKHPDTHVIYTLQLCVFCRQNIETW